MDLDTPLDEDLKEALRQQLRDVEARFHQATTQAEYEELFQLAARREDNLRFFVDLVQGYRMVSQISKRRIKALTPRQRKQRARRNPDAGI